MGWIWDLGFGIQRLFILVEEAVSAGGGIGGFDGRR